MPTRPRRPPNLQPRTRPPRKNTKVTGERSEASFLARAIHLNFGIAKPWGDSRRYDFILDNGERLFRVQVKCTECIRARAYETRATYTIGKGRAVYTKADIDFIAAHVVPLDIWYIIPVEECMSAPMLRFYPHRKAKRMRLEGYREGWSQLLPKESKKVIDIHACADQSNTRPTTIHVGTAAPGCPAGQSPAPARRAADRLREQITRFRELCASSPVTHVQESLAPWPIPPIKILMPRVGKRILPGPLTE